MDETEYVKQFKKKYHTYSVSNILREAAIMIPVLVFSVGVTSGFSWKLIVFAILSSLLFRIFQITLQRYLYKRGYSKIPPQSKYSNKSYKQIQEEKASKSKDV